MLTNNENQPTKPLSIEIENFLRKFKVTDFACNSFLDTLLFKAGINKGINPVAIRFIEPDYLNVGLVIKSRDITKIESFFDFFYQYDNTAAIEHLQNHIYSINMKSSTCLDKIFPIFKEAFLYRIEIDPSCLEAYQNQSATMFLGVTFFNAQEPSPQNKNCTSIDSVQPSSPK